ncbi:hypothetical protein V8C86DRAFT_1190532 [Haematococcus lacustris]
MQIHIELLRLAQPQVESVYIVEDGTTTWFQQHQVYQWLSQSSMLVAPTIRAQHDTNSILHGQRGGHGCEGVVLAGRGWSWLGGGGPGWEGVVLAGRGWAWLGGGGHGWEGVVMAGRGWAWLGGGGQGFHTWSISSNSAPTTRHSSPYASLSPVVLACLAVGQTASNEAKTALRNGLSRHAKVTPALATNITIFLATSCCSMGAPLRLAACPGWLWGLAGCADEHASHSARHVCIGSRWG